MDAPSSDKALISHLAFWPEMGVETAFEDAPVDGLKPRTPKAPAISAPRAADAPAPLQRGSRAVDPHRPLSTTSSPRKPAVS